MIYQSGSHYRVLLLKLSSPFDLTILQVNLTGTDDLSDRLTLQGSVVEILFMTYAVKVVQGHIIYQAG